MAIVSFIVVPVNTASALKQAMKAVKDAGIPEELWSTALPLALADIRGTVGSAGAPPAAATAAQPVTAPATKKKAAKTRPRNGSALASSALAASSVLTGLPDQAAFFKKVSTETGVTVADLGDVFHIQGGQLELKVVSKDLGLSNKASVETITALVGGAVFAGTEHTTIPFRDIHAVSKTKRCFDTNNASSYIKGTTGFAAVGSGANQALTHKSGWQKEFGAAVKRALGKGDVEAK